MFHLLTNDREFAEHNNGLLQGWLGTWTGRAIEAARTMQPLWSLPDARPPRFEDGLDVVKNRFSGILADLNLDAPKELGQ
jgi:propane 2-monooxygenase small subunit